VNVRPAARIFIPEEVENAILKHAAVLECAVIGRPDPCLGSKLQMFQDVDLCTDRLPLSGANKILKHQLRAELLASLEPRG
jgi:acyl-coenzyme A synthetase/AMP-(fatty) acid ligase